MEPTGIKERILLLDVLRGFAIFGMFTVNMTADLPWGDAFREEALASPDRIVVIFVDLLSNGRFITIFSLLFGLGFYIQFERARARGAPFVKLYLRRIGGLFLIASAAIIAGLNASILIRYSIYGLLLLLFYRRTPRFMLISIVLCFLAAKTASNVDYLSSLVSEVAVTQQSEQVPEMSTEVGQEKPLTEQEQEEAERDRIYRTGSFIEIADYRARWLLRRLVFLRGWLSNLDVLGLLLVGLYVGRRRIVLDPEARRKFARKVLPWLLSIGSAGTLGFIIVEHFLSPAWDEPPLLIIKWAIAWPTGWVILGLGYAAAVTLLLERKSWRRVLSPLALVGRLALTNYLFTTFVLAIIRYGWGFGLEGEMGTFAGLMIVLAIYPLQVLASGWWVQHFRFGPFEWFWRTMTYGKVPPMRLSSSGVN